VPHSGWARSSSYCATDTAHRISSSSSAGAFAGRSAVVSARSGATYLPRLFRV